MQWLDRTTNNSEVYIFPTLASTPKSCNLFFFFSFFFFLMICIGSKTHMARIDHPCLVYMGHCGVSGRFSWHSTQCAHACHIICSRQKFTPQLWFQKLCTCMDFTLLSTTLSYIVTSSSLRGVTQLLPGLAQFHQCTHLTKVSWSPNSSWHNSMSLK